MSFEPKVNCQSCNEAFYPHQMHDLRKELCNDCGTPEWIKTLKMEVKDLLMGKEAIARWLTGV